ncbi:MAG: hypothetical protein K6T88_13845 [Bacillus sp. (in: Bacteria)]|nr:hypothetical protein [Bacillus sp. (in: firmicutes)]
MNASILIIVVLAIVASVVGFRKGTANSQRKSIRSNRVRWLVGGYLAVLLACTVLVTINPGKEMDDGKMIPIEDQEKENLNFYDSAKAGRIDTVDSKFINKKWDLNYPDQKLNVALVNAEFLETQIFVERKKTNDGQIEAFYYKTRTSVNGIDITKMTNPISLNLAGNNLAIRNPKKVTLEFSMFNHAFTVRQFTGGDSLFERHSYTYEGGSILYMRIPKDLELIYKENLNLQFVE